ncbi:MAG: HEAT repeat domain-containing protein, partial [Holophagales bacterium]|nr:HEAT repeat domain-containing protein [Holophagales bacterium]
HQSFQEFFFARSLLSDAEGRQPEAWGKTAFPTEIYRFLRDLLGERRDAVDGMLRWLADGRLPAQARVNVAKCLGAVHSVEVMEGLLAALATDAADGVRQAAATALGRQGLTGSHPRGPAYPGIEAALETAARNDDSRFVRANCLTSLARRQHGPARDFLVRVLRGQEPAVRADNRLLLPVFHAARDTGDSELLAACLERAPDVVSKRSAKDLAAVALALVQAHPSEPGFDYAERVLHQTRSPRLAALALDALPPEQGRAFLDRLLPWLRILARNSSRQRHLPELISALRGLATEAVREQMDVLLQKSSSEEVVTAAFGVMVTDFPEHIAEATPRWTGRGRPHGLKIQVAEHLASTDPDFFFALLDRLLGRRQRVSTRLAVLALVHRHLPERFGGLVEELWQNELTTKVKRAAAELLLRLDPERAHRLLHDGLGDARSGTRIVA